MTKQIIKISAVLSRRHKQQPSGLYIIATTKMNSALDCKERRTRSKRALRAPLWVAIINLKGEGEQAREPATHPQHPCKKLGVPARTCNPRAGQADLSGSLALTGQSLKLITPQALVRDADSKSKWRLNEENIGFQPSQRTHTHTPLVYPVANTTRE